MNVVRSHHHPAEHARLVPSPDSTRPTWATVWPWLFWLCWGAWLAVSDLRDTQLQPAIMRVLMGATVLGFARPKRWWVWSAGLAAWVPCEPVLAALMRQPTDVVMSPGMFVLPLMPALVGGFLGRSMAIGVLPRDAAALASAAPSAVTKDRAA